VAQGLDDVGNRVGRLIHLKKVLLECSLVGGQQNIGLDDRYNQVRVMISVGPAGLGSGAFSAMDMTQPSDPRLYGINRILYDKIHMLQSPGRDSTGYMPAVSQVSVVIPLNLDVSYTGAAGNTLSSQCVYFSAVSDSVVAPHPGIASGAIYCVYSDK
jgi:hypothetical protein